MLLRGKLLYNRPLGKRYVVLVSREDAAGMFACGLLERGSDAGIMTE